MKKNAFIGCTSLLLLFINLPCSNSQDSVSFRDTDSSSTATGVKKVDSNNAFFSAITFWNSSSKPEKASEWHQLAQDFLGVQSDDFYINGYAKINEIWIPTLFVRRFQMMKTQYEHILLIKGVPENIPDISGINVETIVKKPDGQVDSFALSVKNIGFNFEMPVIPSVSREEKKLDQQRAVELASMQLEFFGFEKFTWIDSKSNQLKNVADTWQVDLQN